MPLDELTGSSRPPGPQLGNCDIQSPEQRVVPRKERRHTTFALYLAHQRDGSAFPEHLEPEKETKGVRINTKSDRWIIETKAERGERTLMSISGHCGEQRLEAPE